ncbi:MULTISPECIES: DUF3016 domain-containing protein [unclassified Shewanella]|uniref:DUF3016 domain-containing protein n=1 Tax=unclassified Shewanella TaxID=196818 RepID=UPI0021D9AC51|nr:MULTISPECIES: DUF3016 domain-containing protein [unclassified Shewanella]MCU8001804.1 DUF3016 domain-containing protein [Shewanella sp. SM96]MCU8088461.1 DUF3016 domain-containing protein [Shewanella sp. SM21]
MKIQSLLLAGVLSCSAAWAADEAPVDPVTEDGVVKIVWQSPKDYRDIKSSGELQSRYEKRLFETLTENINKEATKILKPNQKLEMTITDVDLAGDMHPTFGATANDLRIIKDIYPPRMTFSYQVMENDKVIIAGDEKLSDMGFMGGIQSLNDKPFMYETKMLTEWLKKTIAPQL